MLNHEGRIKLGEVTGWSRGNMRRLSISIALSASIYLDLLLHIPLLACKVFESIIAVVFVEQTAFAKPLRLVLHLLNNGGFLLWILGKHACILCESGRAINHVRLDDGGVGVRAEIFAGQILFPF